MAVRKIIVIDEEKCDGCGDCVAACHEGAIKIIDGKARLISDTYCDGLGDCLSECHVGAIKIIEREAADFDEAAVAEHLARQKMAMPVAGPSGGCPGSAMRQFDGPPKAAGAPVAATPGGSQPEDPSLLSHWPIQLMLVPPGAPFLQGADLVICADCVPFTVPDFHARYLNGRAVLVGCPKLDDLNFYFDKLQAIFAQAKPSRITVLRMEVPCCGGIADATLRARENSAPQALLEVHTIGVRGGIHEQTVAVRPQES
ncbi:MAG: 4Fe-4S binding protein [candidate division Zixibacteria bacterium]|nr:4Fe-4S binding protein [candidate division Zixibacteria bacterium]MDH3935777.1 4Fe-4S binding protein [candidate division Zixibacteria bacterium]MDH4033986.1 4Fe-4S binding protein [candidate division Zixibacteria bacterium]